MVLVMKKEETKIASETDDKRIGWNYTYRGQISSYWFEFLALPILTRCQQDCSNQTDTTAKDVDSRCTANILRDTMRGP